VIERAFNGPARESLALAAVLFGMSPAGMLRVLASMRCVTVSGMSVMTGLLVIASFMMSGGFAMMSSGMGMMLGCLSMMLDCFL
jgi:hypothetical protein